MPAVQLRIKFSLSLSSTVLNRIPFSVAFQTKMQRILNKLTITGNCFAQAVAGHYSDPDLGKMILG